MLSAAEGTSVPSLTSFADLVTELAGAAADGWEIHVDPTWIRVARARVRVPSQGWKLHVSAALGSAEDVLRRALPVLVSEYANFKLAACPSVLRSLNLGEAGLSQVGKFITVYPSCDAQAVRLAVALHEATRGLRGPVVPSDRPLRPGSLVSYRYGAVVERTVQIPSGRCVAVIRSPGGELVPDDRGGHRTPAWTTDPFIAAGVTEAHDAGLVGGRYLIVATLHESPRGAVHEAVDVVGSRRCVLKRARRDARMGASGLDARDHLRQEAATLARLAGDPAVPEVFELVKHDEDLILAMEHVEGETLTQLVSRLDRLGRHTTPEQVAGWGRELAATLARIHEMGAFYGDLKADNVIRTPGGCLRLVDFEQAREPGFGFGTLGYCSPQAAAGAPPTAADDVYGLGALLYFVATGAPPQMAPNPFALLDRPLRLLNPAIHPALGAVIERCLEPDTGRRWPSMAALEAALTSLEEAAVEPPPLGGWPEPAPRAGERYRALAGRLGDSLCAAADAIGDPDLGTGRSGVVLALAELVGELGRGSHGNALVAAARELAASPAGDDALAGLYVGQAGIGTALLRAGQVLGDPALVAAAMERGRLVATLEHRSPDIYHGTAGRLRFHLLLHDETGSAEQLDAAFAAGERLLTTAEESGEAGLAWRIPEGYESLSGSACLGYAHGSAGIADALLDLYDATADDRFLSAASTVGEALVRSAICCLDDGSGLTWRHADGEAPAAAMWCHGATGVGRFLLHAAQLGVAAGAGSAAAGAARMAARGARSAGSTQCHGLAGSIELLLDVAQATGEAAYVNEAFSLARLLEAFVLERDGALLCIGEGAGDARPGYLLGGAGLVACLLRLADPARRPSQLSRRGLRYRPDGVAAVT